jgi:hypothetical protein
MRLARIKPGSLDQFGNVIDYQGATVAYGPCFIPEDISPARKGRLGEAGWCKTPASHWPSISPHSGLFCIHRGALK